MDSRPSGVPIGELARLMTKLAITRRLPAVMALLFMVAVLGACGTTSTSGGSANHVTPASPTTVTLSPPGPPTQPTSVTDIFLPRPDDPAIPVYEALGWGAEHALYIYWLQIGDGWAYIHGIPYTTDNGPTIDTRALLHQNGGGAWQVVEASRTKGLLTDIGGLDQDSAVSDQMKQAHPDAPMAIFPPDSANRVAAEEVLDAVRTALGRPGYRFNVFSLTITGDRASADLRALLYDQDGYQKEVQEGSAVLQKVDGAWKVLKTGRSPT